MRARPQRLPGLSAPTFLALLLPTRSRHLKAHGAGLNINVKQKMVRMSTTITPIIQLLSEKLCVRYAQRQVEEFSSHSTLTSTAAHAIFLTNLPPLLATLIEYSWRQFMRHER